MTTVQKHDLAFPPLEVPRCIPVVNGRCISVAAITDTARAPFVLGGHIKSMPMFFTKMDRYPIILGLSLLNIHHSDISWTKKVVSLE